MDESVIVNSITDLNKRICQKTVALRQGAGKKEGMPKLAIARDYWCDAVLLALQRRLDEATYKLKQSEEILKGVE